MDKSVLYIGSLAGWSNSSRRFKALKTICDNTDPIDTDPYLLPKIIVGIQHHLNRGPGIFLLNRKIREHTRRKKYDIVLVDNKPYLSKKTLRFIKSNQSSVKIADLLTDDPFGKFTRSWPLLKRTASLYDIFFVQREVNIMELKNAGANDVALCYRSFDPAYNRPLELNQMDSEKYHSLIGFVGTYETERASYIAYLIQNNIPVSVTGNDWPGGEYWDIIKPYYRGPSVYGEEYIKTINGMDVALHFLRHGNRDEQDSRTFEIPACKIFMLAERSELHLQLFKENEEAVFFTSKEELLEKVKFYLAARAERERIAVNGYRKCFSGGYDHESRMQKVLETINDLNTN
ncbi:MAG TPA: glycosyltransferase [Hanamia sp.]|nr:glycosyltransferase [Hanamia sp.]